MVEPDISVICNPEKLSDRGCEGAPDWVIEIVSPWSKKRDYWIKLNKYLAAGIKDYWIIDPGKECIRVYRNGEEMDTFEVSFDEPVIPVCFPGLSIQIRDYLNTYR